MIWNTVIGCGNLNQGMFIGAVGLLGLEFENLNDGVVDAVLELRRRSKLRKPTSTSMETTEKPKWWGVSVFWGLGFFEIPLEERGMGAE